VIPFMMFLLLVLAVYAAGGIGRGMPSILETLACWDRNK